MPVHSRGLCVVLLGLGVGWGAGNVGPVAVSLTHSFGVSLAAVGLLSGAAYFALPYAVMIDAAGRLFSGQATATLALLQTGPNVVPIVVIPLVGSALESQYAPWAFLTLAAFVAAAGIANLRSPPAADSNPVIQDTVMRPG